MSESQKMLASDQSALAMQRHSTKPSYTEPLDCQGKVRAVVSHARMLVRSSRTEQ